MTTTPISVDGNISFGMPRILALNLLVTDTDCIEQLLVYDDETTRSEYGLSALKIGLLSLRHACGHIDAETVKAEAGRLFTDINHVLADYRRQMNDGLAAFLKEYFDPETGRFQERVDRLIKRDGDLEQLLSRHLGTDSSELANTLATYIGKNSQLMKLLDPQESTGVISTLTHSVSELLTLERNHILAEFSLDNPKSALNNLVSELTEENGKLKQDFSRQIDLMVKEFSLDSDQSALSRLLRRLETAHQTISNELSLDNESSALSQMSRVIERATEAIDSNLTLDNEQSALARLRRELLEIINKHGEKASAFQEEVVKALAAMSARRQESLRSTTHGKDFEHALCDFVSHEAQRIGDIPTITANTTGRIKHCKIGDCVVELGCDSAAAHDNYVIEAKEDSTYDLAKAHAELDSARKNRAASVGIFVFSRRTAPMGLEPLLRNGDDIFVIWDSQDMQSDVYLKAAMTVAKALCIRQNKLKTNELADIHTLEQTILEIEREAKRLDEINKWTETIKSNSGKILDEIRKMDQNIEKQLESLRQTAAGLKTILD